MQDTIISLNVAFPVRAVVLARDSGDTGFDNLGGEFPEGIGTI